MAQDIQDYVHDPPTGEGGRGAVPIAVRGTRDGLLLSVPEDARVYGARVVAAALAAHIDESEAFFNGAEVIVDLGEREFTADEISFYRLVLEEREVIVRGFTASSTEGRAVLRKQGYHPLQVVPPPSVVPQSAPGTPHEPPGHWPEAVEGAALYLRRTLRSGARVHHHGNLIVVGDINAGAEVVASGDIIIWGQVRGMVHAGALGDDNAIICALVLNPTQLRIGSHYALPPGDKRAKKKDQVGPERARLENGQIVVEPWKTK